MKLIIRLVILFSISLENDLQSGLLMPVSAVKPIYLGAVSAFLATDSFAAFIFASAFGEVYANMSNCFA